MTQKERDRITVIETKTDLVLKSVSEISEKLDKYHSVRLACEKRITKTEAGIGGLYALAVLIASGLVAVFFRR